MIRKSRRNGQAIVETCIAIGIILLIFMAVLQLSDIIAARQVLGHAAARGARAKAVGFNQWMVSKTIHVGSIPNAGKMTYPVIDNTDIYLRNQIASASPGTAFEHALAAAPASSQVDMEKSRIPDYLYAANQPRANYIIDYEDWDTIGHSQSSTPVPQGVTALNAKTTVRVYQDYPLKLPLHRTFYAGDSIDINVESTMENHYDLYLDDQGW